MTRVRNGFLLAITTTGLLACGSDSKDITETPEVDGAFADTVEPLDRAAEVEALVDERKADIDAALEAAEEDNP